MTTTRRTALVTDASTLAAEAVAERLERDGLAVIRNYPDGLPETCRNREGRCSYRTDDLEQVRAMSRWAAEKGYAVRALVHSDNVILRASVEEIPEEDFFACVDRNAKSAFMATKVFAEEIAQAGGGSVVYLSSVHGEKPTGVSFAYSVGKGAVKMLCREMSLFYGRKGVRCNLVEMDATIETVEQLDSAIVPFNYELERKVPLGRATRPADFAGAVAFLISDDAAQINGADLLVDGGHLRWYLDR